MENNVLTAEEQIERLETNIDALIDAVDEAFEKQGGNKRVAGEIQILECVGQAESMKVLVYAEACQTAMDVLKKKVGSKIDKYKVNCHWDKLVNSRLMFAIEKEK